jgi:hypothetical protein
MLVIIYGALPPGVVTNEASNHTNTNGHLTVVKLNLGETNSLTGGQ